MEASCGARRRYRQNSGRLRGAVDQILADTVGEELVLTPKPNLAACGYNEAETIEFVRMVKDIWKRRAWNARECDFRGKFIVPQMIDMALRSMSCSARLWAPSRIGPEPSGDAMG